MTQVWYINIIVASRKVHGADGDEANADTMKEEFSPEAVSALMEQA